jgi:hypothetical protein
MFDSKNLLLDQNLESTYRQLLGIEGEKPLECIGEIRESRTAMRLAQSKYSQLSKYVFDLPQDYDYKALAEHSMPPGVYEIILRSLK